MPKALVTLVSTRRSTWEFVAPEGADELSISREYESTIRERGKLIDDSQSDADIAMVEIVDAFEHAEPDDDDEDDESESEYDDSDDDDE